MTGPVKLLGLDFGSTTSSAMTAQTLVCRNAVTGRMELGALTEVWRSPLQRTPFQGQTLDLVGLEALLQDWLGQAGREGVPVFGGGALVTGLAAQASNAGALGRLLQARLGELLIASVQDPCLESWMAFMGSAASLSRLLPEQPILNLDIGGGTTNLALGLGGRVLATGCLNVGARHVQLAPGTLCLTGCSSLGEMLLQSLELETTPGSELTPAALDRILDYYLELLEAACTGQRAPFLTSLGEAHEAAPLPLPSPDRPEGRLPLLTFSGGVATLLYGRLEDQPEPDATAFGDLGVLLARRLASDHRFQPHLALDALRAAGLPFPDGRATVFGLMRHSTQVSGTTLYLSRPERLPLRAVPILGRLTEDTPLEQLQRLLWLVKGSQTGGCLEVRLGQPDARGLKQWTEKLRGALGAVAFPPDCPLVLVMAENVGKALGGYLTRWGQDPLHLLVIDELSGWEGQFVQVGRLHAQVLPVSFYGMNR